MEILENAGNDIWHISTLDKYRRFRIFKDFWRLILQFSLLSRIFRPNDSCFYRCFHHSSVLFENFHFRFLS